jgi:hypothetical protein
MITNSDIVVLVIVLAGGVLNLIRWLKARKVEETKRASILYVIMAVCLFSFSLGIPLRVFSPTHSLARVILVIQGILAGVGFGIFLAMRILGHFQPLGKTHEVSDEDSQKIDDLKQS